MAVFLADVGDVGAAGFEDPQAEEAERGDQREVVRAVGQIRMPRHAIGRVPPQLSSRRAWLAMSTTRTSHHFGCQNPA
ncbi:hypothetical protein [Plantactinospora veratri]